jgi:ATP-dependent Lhr-like helicase
MAPSARLVGHEGTLMAVRQLYGLARPAESWEREYLPSRVDEYDPDAVSRAIAAGELVWIGGSTATKLGEIGSLATIRFVQRGTARAWIPAADTTPLTGDAQHVIDSLAREGASFFDELASATSLTSRALRDALRELVGAGLVTNDTMDSLRAVMRWRPIVSPRDRAQPDPTRWLPADFTPSANRYVVQRRPNLRRLPKWKRPDKEGAEPSTWPGRWSLVRAPRVLGPEVDESVWAESIARQWLARYGIVSREVWRRERPAIGWRAIYRELKRLEFRGDVRRGYFVQGLSGAQFALPEAVEALRSGGEDEPEPIVMPATDPANVFTLPMPGDPARDSFVRPRSRGALLVTVGGAVTMIAERRAARVVVRPDTTDSLVTRCAQALVAHLSARTKRDIIVETIDGQPASGSRYAEAFRLAGFRRGTSGLRYYQNP